MRLGEPRQLTRGSRSPFRRSLSIGRKYHESPKRINVVSTQLKDLSHSKILKSPIKSSITEAIQPIPVIGLNTFVKPEPFDEPLQNDPIERKEIEEKGYIDVVENEYIYTEDTNVQRNEAFEIVRTLSQKFDPSAICPGKKLKPFDFLRIAQYEPIDTEQKSMTEVKQMDIRKPMNTQRKARIDSTDKKILNTLAAKNKPKSNKLAMNSQTGKKVNDDLLPPRLRGRVEDTRPFSGNPVVKGLNKTSSENLINKEANKTPSEKCTENELNKTSSDKLAQKKPIRNSNEKVVARETNKTSSDELVKNEENVRMNTQASSGINAIRNYLGKAPILPHPIPSDDIQSDKKTEIPESDREIRKKGIRNTSSYKDANQNISGQQLNAEIHLRNDRTGIPNVMDINSRDSRQDRRDIPNMMDRDARGSRHDRRDIPNLMDRDVRASKKMNSVGNRQMSQDCPRDVPNGPHHMPPNHRSMPRRDDHDGQIIHPGNVPPNMIGRENPHIPPLRDVHRDYRDNPYIRPLLDHRDISPNLHNEDLQMHNGRCERNFPPRMQDRRDNPQDMYDRRDNPHNNDRRHRPDRPDLFHGEQPQMQQFNNRNEPYYKEFDGRNQNQMEQFNRPRDDNIRNFRDDREMNNMNDPMRHPGEGRNYDRSNNRPYGRPDNRQQSGLPDGRHDRYSSTRNNSGVRGEYPDEFHRDNIPDNVDFNFGMQPNFNDAQVRSNDRQVEDRVDNRRKNELFDRKRDNHNHGINDRSLERKNVSSMDLNRERSFNRNPERSFDDKRDISTNERHESYPDKYTNSAAKKREGSFDKKRSDGHDSKQDRSIDMKHHETSERKIDRSIDRRDRSVDTKRDTSIDRKGDNSVNRRRDGNRKRDGSVDKKRDRSVDRKRDRSIDRKRDGSVDRKRDRSLDRKGDKSDDKKRAVSVDGKRDKSIDRKRDRSADKKRDKSTDRKLDRPTDRKRDGSVDGKRNRSVDRKRERSPDRKRDRSTDRNRDRSQDRKRDRSQDRKRDRSQDRKRDRSQDRKRDRSQDRKRDRSQDRKRDRSQDRKRDRSQDRKRDRSQDRKRDRSTERKRDKSVDRKKDKSSDRNLGKSSDRKGDRSAHKKRDKSVDKKRHRSGDGKQDRSDDIKQDNSSDSKHKSSSDRNGEMFSKNLVQSATIIEKVLDNKQEKYSNNLYKGTQEKSIGELPIQDEFISKDTNSDKGFLESHTSKTKEKIVYEGKGDNASTFVDCKDSLLPDSDKYSKLKGNQGLYDNIDTKSAVDDENEIMLEYSVADDRFSDDDDDIPTDDMDCDSKVPSPRKDIPRTFTIHNPNVESRTVSEKFIAHESEVKSMKQKSRKKHKKSDLQNDNDKKPKKKKHAKKRSIDKVDVDKEKLLKKKKKKSKKVKKSSKDHDESYAISGKFI